MAQAQTRQRADSKKDTGAPKEGPQQSSASLPFVFNEAIIQENTGAFLPRSKYLASLEDQERLIKQTRYMADKLEEAGFKVKMPSQISMIMDVTGEVFELEAWRNVNVLPAVAQKNRREMMRDLEHYFHRHGKDYWRYAVLTFGDRLPAFSDLAGAVRAAKKKVRKWRHLAKRDFGVTFGFIGFEFPRDAETGTYHLHVNVLYRTPLFLDKGAAWRKFTRDFFGYWWKDAGQISNLKEMLKYPFKPNDVAGCEGDELRWLAEEMFNLRITELLGPIQELRKQRRDAGLKVAMIKGNPVLRTAYKFPRSQAEIDAEEARKAYDEGKEKTPRGDAYNIIIGRVMPSFRASPWAESATLVYNYNPDPHWQRDRDRLIFLKQNQREAREIWDAKGCPEPEVAKAFAKAVRSADNVVAFRDARQKARSKRRAGEARYIVHNKTISVPDSFAEIIERWEGPGESIIELWSEPEPEVPKRPPESGLPPAFTSIEVLGALMQQNRARKLSTIDPVSTSMP